MFQHPVLRNTARTRPAAYGELTGWNYYAVVLPNGFNFEPAWADALRAKGVAMNGNSLPNNSIVLVETGAPLLSNYDILWVNGADIRIPVGGAVYPNGLGAHDAAVALENALEKHADSKNSFESREKALAKAKELWAAQADGATTPVPDADAGEPPTSDAGSSPATSTAPSGAPSAPKTGYYTDNAGWAWYYNADKDYMEAVAAPKGKYTSQPRFTKGSGKVDYVKMKGVLTEAAYKGSTAAARAQTIDNATSKGGDALPASGSVTKVAPAPAEVANRGAKQQGGEGVPAWVWWTGGTVAVAGLAVGGAIWWKKHLAGRA